MAAVNGNTKATTVLDRHLDEQHRSSTNAAALILLASNSDTLFSPTTSYSDKQQDAVRFVQLKNLIL